MPSASARRASSPDEVADLLGPDDDRISVGALVQQGVSAVIVGLLGLFGIAGISTLSAPYSTAAEHATTAVAGSYDVTRAEPDQSSLGLDSAAATEDTPAADLDDPSRNADISRNTIRSEVNKAVSAELEQQRQGNLAEVQEQVATGAQNAAADQRAAQLDGQSAAITEEQSRLKAEAAAKAEAERLAREQAALAAGTLTSGSKAAADPKVVAALTSVGSSGCTTPMASYIRGAGWGATGSWSRYHTGVDLSAPYGTPIRAACSGVVLAADGGGWAGINVSIAHSGGGATLYAHMSAKLVKPGDVVKAGQVIGYVGLTGRTFGAHLHFEYYPNPSTIGDPYTTQDPVAYMLRRGVRV